jgi:hypothetical protein
MQATNNILLIRPANFNFNNETALSNAFQQLASESELSIRQAAINEFDAFAKKIALKGVNVTVIDDTAFPPKPDAIFPNNWVSFHADGSVILYPICAANRRPERRIDIIQTLQEKFIITQVIDLSYYEKENRFLESTGSIIFDHENKIAYACLSPRTDKNIFIEVCALLQYKPIYFTSTDKNGQAIYHTNVMMCIGSRFCAICLESITDLQEKETICDALRHTGHQIIDISFEQASNFAGNMLELSIGDEQNILALSQTAYDSLHIEQKTILEKLVELVPLSIKTIETIGGGSARCMIAEIFLEQKLLAGNVVN